MREAKAKIQKHLKTHRITVPVAVRQDSQYPFKDKELVSVIIVDYRTVMLRKVL